MAAAAPKIAFRLQIPTLVLLLFWALFYLFVWNHNRLVGLAIGVAGLALCIYRLGILSTQITEAGVSQWTWRGRIALSWDDIALVSKTRSYVVLEGSKGSIRVPIPIYYDSRAVAQFLTSHLPHNVDHSALIPDS